MTIGEPLDVLCLLTIVWQGQCTPIENRSEIKDQKIRRDQEIKIKDQMLGSRKNSS